jgi:hypothetical protein
MTQKKKRQEGREIIKGTSEDEKKNLKWRETVCFIIC